MFGFNQKPRGFHHTYIYVDERRERLGKLEERARQQIEQGETAKTTPHRSLLHFSADSQKRRDERVKSITRFRNTLIPIIIIGGAALFCCYFYFC